MRKLDVMNRRLGESSNRGVFHVQFTNWQDKSVPKNASDLIELVHLTRLMVSQFNEDQEDSSSPVLVHCSAGVGRTGECLSL